MKDNNVFVNNNVNSNVNSKVNRMDRENMIDGVDALNKNKVIVHPCEIENPIIIDIAAH